MPGIRVTDDTVGDKGTGTSMLHPTWFAHPEKVSLASFDVFRPRRWVLAAARSFRSDGGEWFLWFFVHSPPVSDFEVGVSGVSKGRYRELWCQGRSTAEVA